MFLNRLMLFKGGSLRSFYTEELICIPASNFSNAKMRTHQKPKASKTVVSSFPALLIHVPVFSWPTDTMRFTLLSRKHKRTGRGHSQDTVNDSLANTQRHLTLLIPRELPDLLREPQLLHLHTLPLHHPQLPPTQHTSTP